MALPSTWIKVFRTEKDQQSFEEILRNSSIVVDRISQIIDEWERELDSKDTEKDFDTPNWDVKQAYRLGDRARLRKLRELFSFRNNSPQTRTHNGVS